MKKILITGNSGYIGSHLSRLLNRSYDLWGLDISKPQFPVTDHVMADISKLAGMKLDLPVFDAVVHLAARVRVNESVRIPQEYYQTNLFGTIEILDKISCKNFIFASTGCAEYCNNPYAISKRAAEDVVSQQCEKLGIAHTIFRFYNVVGSLGFPPTNPDGLFYNLMRAEQTGIFNIFGNDYRTRDGTAERDYVHVDEICRALQMAIENPANGRENLGHGSGHTVREIAELYQKVNDIQFRIEYQNRRTGDLERTVLDNPSRYMLKLYELDELVKIPKNMQSQLW